MRARLRSTSLCAFACAVALAFASPARADVVAGLNMGAPVWDGVLAKDALAAAVATGAPQVRVNFRLDKWSSPKDQAKVDGRTFFEAYDIVVDAITSQGLEVYGLLSDELTAGVGPKDPGFDDAWVANATAIVERYRDRVRVFETINEPNNWDETKTARMTPAAFARAHAKLYDAVKAQHPGDACWDVALVTGPLLSFDGTTGTDYLAQAIDSGRAGGAWKSVVDRVGHDPIDGVGYHVYVTQGPDSPLGTVGGATATNLDALRAMLSARGLGDRRTWLSEVGFRASLVGPSGQAERLDATFDALAARTDVAAAHWFTIADFGGDETWGLFGAGFAKTDERPSRARFVDRAKRHAPALAAKVTIDLPKTIAGGAKAVAKVTATNIGKTTWRAADGIRLGAAAGCPSAWATNDLAWAADGAGYATSATDARRFLSRDVAQGESVTIDVPFTAPAVVGKNRLAARMVKEGEAWFGATAIADVDIVDPSMAPGDGTTPNGAGEPADPGATSDPDAVAQREPAADGGCGCATAPRPASSWAALALAGACLLVRRRTKPKRM